MRKPAPAKGDFPFNAPEVAATVAAAHNLLDGRSGSVSAKACYVGPEENGRHARKVIVTVELVVWIREKLEKLDSGM